MKTRLEGSLLRCILRGSRRTAGLPATAGLILRWDGEDWTTAFAYTAPEDDPSGAAWAIYALDFSGPDDGWAAGAIAYPDGRSQPLLLHWNGLRWLEVDRSAGVHRMRVQRGAGAEQPRRVAGWRR